MNRSQLLWAWSKVAVMVCVLACVGAHDVAAQPISSIVEFYEFTFVEFGGRPGHQGYFPKQSAPAPGEQATVRAKLFGPVENVHLEFVNAAGNVIGVVPLSSPAGITSESPEYYGSAIVPTEPFFVRAMGVDRSGKPFDTNTLGNPIVVPNKLQIHLTPLSPLLVPRTTAVFSAQLENFGEPETFTLSASTSPQAPTTLSSSALTLGSHESKTVELAIVVPDNVDPLGRLTLTFRALGIATRVENVVSLAVNLAVNPGQTLVVDVIPGSCENTVNVKSRGVTPVAIIATDQLDPTTIDPRTIYIAGIVAPLRVAVEDVGSPGLESCSSGRGDGHSDLLLHFDTQELVAAIFSMLPNVAQTKTQQVSVPVSARTTNGVECRGFGSIRLRQ